MGHYVSKVDRMFREVKYQQKTTAELRTALQAKIERIAQLIKDRTSRVERICREFEITDQELTNLVLQYKDDDEKFISFEAQTSSRVVPAGAIANIIQEKKMSKSERSQLRKLELVERNLKETELYAHPQTGEIHTRECIHELSDEELEYLGF